MPGARIAFIAPLVAIASGFGSVPDEILLPDDLRTCPCDATNAGGSQIFCGRDVSSLTYSEFRQCSQCYPGYIKTFEAFLRAGLNTYTEINDACKLGELNLYKIACDPEGPKTIRDFAKSQLLRGVCESCEDAPSCEVLLRVGTVPTSEFPTEGRNCADFEIGHIVINTNRSGRLTQGWCGAVTLDRIRTDRAKGRLDGRNLVCEDYYMFQDYCAGNFPHVSIIDRALRCETKQGVDLEALLANPASGNVPVCVGAGTALRDENRVRFNNPNYQVDPTLVSIECRLNDDILKENGLSRCN